MSKQESDAPQDAGGPVAAIDSATKAIPSMRILKAVVALSAAMSLVLAFSFGNYNYAIYGGVAVFAFMVLLRLYQSFEPQEGKTDPRPFILVILSIVVIAFATVVVYGLIFLGQKLFAETPDERESLITATINEVNDVSGDFEHARNNTQHLPKVELRAIDLVRRIDNLPKINRTWSAMCIEPKAYCYNIAVDARFCSILERLNATNRNLEGLSDEEVRALISPEDKAKLSEYAEITLNYCKQFETETANAYSSAQADDVAIRIWLESNKTTQILESIGYEKLVALAAKVFLGESEVEVFVKELANQQARYPSFWKENPVDTSLLLSTVDAMVKSKQQENKK